jgi:hypothetical protein
VLGRIHAAEDADAIIYDAASNRVFTFNGDAHSSTVIDPVSNRRHHADRRRPVIDCQRPSDSCAFRPSASDPSLSLSCVSSSSIPLEPAFRFSRIFEMQEPVHEYQTVRR